MLPGSAPTGYSGSQNSLLMAHFRQGRAVNYLLGFLCNVCVLTEIKCAQSARKRTVSFTIFEETRVPGQESS